MWLFLSLTLLLEAVPTLSLNLKYLNPINLQTARPTQVQKTAALDIIRRYSYHVTVEIDRAWFKNNKDAFYLKTYEGRLHITASTGVAAVWGFNYYLKKYCKSQIEWQTTNVFIPDPMPEVNEVVVANDRFRYYQNVCTVSYSFVWWNIRDWKRHLEWMALNGINLSLAPVAQEAIWARVYLKIGMTQEEIDKHFTGPAFLTWLRKGNVHGWGGPLPNSWHDLQNRIQILIIDSMLNLGIVPVLPAFNGHVPRAFSRLYPNSTFHRVKPWNHFGYDYCCDMFIDPYDPLFKNVATQFLEEMGKIPGCHIFQSDAFNEVVLPEFDTDLVAETARIIILTLTEFDEKAVWLLQNVVFIYSGYNWPKYKVRSFLNTIPNGRILILDLQAEKSPKYDKYDMYFGQPFIWCMLHNFGGTLGMFGNMVTINKDVYEVRSRVTSTMIGIGLTPEGINQNYVVYDLMLESAWRKSPVQDLDVWVADYAERRYGCNTTAGAWKYLLKSVYSYKGFREVDGLYIVTKKPKLNYDPWAWYKEIDLFEAFERLVFINNSNCDTMGYCYDVVDVTRQALQYRIEQLYVKMVSVRKTDELNKSVHKFLEAFDDMALILATDENFRASKWFTKARALGNSSEESDLYEYNAWNQITHWGLINSNLNDHACKQWSEMVTYYYRPEWARFLYAYSRTKDRNRNQEFEDRYIRSNRSSIQNSRAFLRGEVFGRVDIHEKPYDLAKRLYNKWVSVPDIQELPMYTTRNPVRSFKNPPVNHTPKTTVYISTSSYSSENPVKLDSTDNPDLLNASHDSFNIMFRNNLDIPENSKLDSSENPMIHNISKNSYNILNSDIPDKLLINEKFENSIIDIFENTLIETTETTIVEFPKNTLFDTSENPLNHGSDDLDQTTESPGIDYLEPYYHID